MGLARCRIGRDMKNLGNLENSKILILPPSKAKSLCNCFVGKRHDCYL